MCIWKSCIGWWQGQDCFVCFLGRLVRLACTRIRVLFDRSFAWFVAVPSTNLDHETDKTRPDQCTALISRFVTAPMQTPGFSGRIRESQASLSAKSFCRSAVARPFRSRPVAVYHSISLCGSPSQLSPPPLIL